MGDEVGTHIGTNVSTALPPRHLSCAGGIWARSFPEAAFLQDGETGWWPRPVHVRKALSRRRGHWVPLHPRVPAHPAVVVALLMLRSLSSSCRWEAPRVTALQVSVSTGWQRPWAVHAVLEGEPTCQFVEGSLVSAPAGKLVETFGVFFTSFILRFLLI